MVNFRPLHIAKRRHKEPWSSSLLTKPSERPLSIDKDEYHNHAEKDDDWSSVYSSSRSSSEAYEPMLKENRKDPMQTSYSFRKSKKKFNVYFTIVLGSIIVGLVILLLVLSAWSARRVADGIRKPEPERRVWESFPRLKRYYGGIMSLVDRENNDPEYPIPHDELSHAPGNDLRKSRKPDATSTYDPDFADLADTYRQTLDLFDGKGDTKRVKCFLDGESETETPQLESYKGVVDGFPNNIIGSYSLLGLDDSVCFDNLGRLAPYEFERESGRRSAEISWADAQCRCEQANRHRFSLKALPNSAERSSLEARQDDAIKTSVTSAAPLNRTAILIRTQAEHRYTREETLHLRALISETALASSGEMAVHFLIQVDHDQAIWADSDAYSAVLNASLPSEFRGMGTLWSSRQMQFLYGSCDTAIYSLQQHRAESVQSCHDGKSILPVQYFAQQHPEFDFFWDWPLAARYTGHYFSFFNQTSAWATRQPRKELWERNAKFYVPTEHGSWDAFSKLVHEHAAKGPQAPVWGAALQWDDAAENDTSFVKAPRPAGEDAYEWGVGEEAELITLAPLFDPEGSRWASELDVWGQYASSSSPPSPSDEGDDARSGQIPSLPPRRASMSSATRLSRRLLEAMHTSTLTQKQLMAPEMWPASIALHRGFKAVYVPHPVFVERAWPPGYLEAVFNAGWKTSGSSYRDWWTSQDAAANGYVANGGGLKGGRSLDDSSGDEAGRAVGRLRLRPSVFGSAQQHNLRGLSWSPVGDAKWAGRLWKRWLGPSLDGGSAFGRDKRAGDDRDEGPMCLPAMLLYPVSMSVN